MAADGVQLFLQALLHDLGQRVAIVPLGVFPGGIPELLFCALDAGRVGAARDGADVAVDAGRYLAGIGHDDLVGLFPGQVAELVQHILGGAVEQGRLVVRVLEAVARLQDRAVDGVLRLGEMDIAGGDDGLVQVFAQLDDGAVEVLDDLFALHLSIPHHIGVVAQRLYLQNIVIRCNFLQFFVGAALHDRPVKFSCFTGRSEDKAVPVLVQKAAGNAGLLEEVVDMGLADDLIEVFQAHLAAHEDDEVIILLLQHLAVPAEAGVDAADGGDLFFLQIFQHDAEDAAQCGRVLAGAMGLVGGQLQMLVDGPLLVVVETGVHGLSHGQGVDIGRLKLDSAPLGGGAEEPDVEGVGIVSHKDAAIHKVEEGFQRLGLAGGVSHHLVGDAGQLGDLGGDGLSGFYEGVEFFHHLPVPHDDRADLCQIFHAGVEARRLSVEDAELAVQRLVFHAVDAGYHVIDKVGLTAVNELEVRVCLMDGVRRQHGLGVALTDAVVGDGDGRVAHPVGQFDDAAGVAEGVHTGQLGMQMQLHPLDGGVVLPLFALDKEDVVGPDDIVVLVLIVGAVAAHHDRRTLGDGLPLGAVLPFLRTDLQVDGAGVIGDGDRVYLAEAALHLGEEDVAPDHALAALAAQILEGGEVFRGEHLAVEDGDGLVREVEALHLDGGSSVLFLKLDDGRRNFPLELFFHLALFGLAHAAFQRHFGFYAGVGSDALCQQALELHLLQKLRAVADADGDVLAGDGDAAAVEEAVDGDTVPLHLLHQLPQTGFIQRRIAEKIVDAELEALVIRCQRGQQPGAQPLVQRGRTAQRKDDLPLLPQHLGVLDDHAAKTGRKVRVRHKLRP